MDDGRANISWLKAFKNEPDSDLSEQPLTVCGFQKLNQIWFFISPPKLSLATAHHKNEVVFLKQTFQITKIEMNFDEMAANHV